MIIILIPLIFGVIGAFWAASKNRSALLWGLICFLFGPIGLVILAFKGTEASLEQKIGAAINATAPRVNVVETASDDKWLVLVKYDDDVKKAVEELSVFGEDAISKLRIAHAALNDKSKIPLIVNDIREAFLAARHESVQRRIQNSNIFTYKDGVIFGLKDPIEFIVIQSNSHVQRFPELSSMESAVTGTKDRDLMFGADREKLLAQYSDLVGININARSVKA